MDFLLTPLNAFAQHVDLAHVLVLNLIGWVCKGCMGLSSKLRRWTDIIPVQLGMLGIILAYMDPNMVVHHPIVQGLANAGLAWMLHQGAKRTQEQFKDYKENKLQEAETKLQEAETTRQQGTGDGEKT